MSWILLLIELVPVVIKTVNVILELIKLLPRRERPEARRALGALARKHVRKVRAKRGAFAAAGQKAYALTESPATVVEEFEAMEADLRARIELAIDPE